MTLSDPLEELCQAMRYLYLKGLITALSGNASVKLDETKIAITPSGKTKFMLTPKDISVVSLDGRHLAGPRPSIETEMHIGIYLNCPDCGSVVHIHGLFTPVLAGLLSPVEDLELKTFEVRICHVGELLPGSKELARAVSSAVASGCKVVILKNHGVVGIGKSLGEALEVVEAVENSFKRSLTLHILNILNEVKLSSPVLKTAAEKL
ncbi:MAG: class II aldolase/adducin family protein [Sulfolobales archaeon]